MTTIETMAKTYADLYVNDRAAAVAYMRTIDRSSTTKVLQMAMEMILAKSMHHD